MVGILLSVFPSAASHLPLLDTPEIGPGELINGSNSTTRTTSPNPTGFPVATPSSLSPSSSSTSSKSSSNTGAIVGGIVGGIAIIAAAVLGSVYLFRRRTKGPSVVNDASRLHEGDIGKLSNDEESFPRPEVPPPPMRDPVRTFVFLLRFCLFMYFFLVLVYPGPKLPTHISWAPCRLAWPSHPFPSRFQSIPGRPKHLAHAGLADTRI